MRLLSLQKKRGYSFINRSFLAKFAANLDFI